MRTELKGVHREAISSQRVLTGLIEVGMSRRLTGANAQNANSSRSHAFLTVEIEKETKHEDGKLTKEVTYMHLVDLAGSEKFNSNDAEGLAINQSLLCLGKVIMAKAREDHHVPYRDTIITRMLRDTLEAECTTVVLACLNPGTDTMAETKNVLKFMERAAAIDKDQKKEGKAKNLKPGQSIMNQKRVLAAAAEIAGGKDPLHGDKEDEVKHLLRRTESIMTKSYGAIPARVCGDPMAPLVLYLHNTGAKKEGIVRKGRTSKIWNPLVTELGERMKELSDIEAKTAARKVKPPPRKAPKKGEAAKQGVELPVSQIAAGSGASSQRSARQASPSPGRKVQSARGASTSRSDGDASKGGGGSAPTEEKKRKGKEASVADGAEKAKKKEGVAEGDDRLAELRSELFLLLRSRQQELAATAAA